ncbi:hypothetical protein [Streptantibioticus silvisoli]|uniref:Integral membrane protein n=1 Tax=Streptantibioticus silvisoli TaxID=2705255 RepID=A0ABT6VZF2_9ACTN|nr:hypothetical protein [Streptantibioticus silvisoli]MDI5963868.1 hypothetical protein [Streptantibioticus silvisoli]
MTQTRSGRPGGAPEAGAGAGRLRGPVDPVLALIHRHYDLCARAVDPLEIAAGLEAHGITDRIAARFRHRDVFTLAEELYARVPRDHAPDCPERDGTGVCPEQPMGRRAVALHLLPGVVCGAGVAVSRLTPAGVAPVTGGVALAAVALAARTAARSGPLRASGARGSTLWTCWLLAFALYGPYALQALLGDGSARPRGLLDPVSAAGFLARALALLPAAWCARRFARGARGRLADSHGLAGFRAGVRPLLVAALGLFTVALLALVGAAYALLGHRVDGVDLVGLTGAAALGVLLFTAQLLAVHGFAPAAAWGLGTVCAAQAAGLAAAACAGATSPLRALVTVGGPGVVQAAVCGAGALALALYALPALGRAAAHGGDRPAAPPPYDAAYAAALFGGPPSHTPTAPAR